MQCSIDNTRIASHRNGIITSRTRENCLSREVNLYSPENSGTLPHAMAPVCTRHPFLEFHLFHPRWFH